MNFFDKLFKRKPKQEIKPEIKPKKVRQRFNQRTKGAFGKCKINKMMRNMRVYPRHKVREALEEMMK